MQTRSTDMRTFQGILERKEAELVHMLRKRDGIAIEKSADEMDEIQYASERDMAIRNVDREAHLLREVKATLRRVYDGSFGTCIDCESPIAPKRLAAVPWASRCIQCQDAADRAIHGLWSTQRECNKGERRAGTVCWDQQEAQRCGAGASSQTGLD